MARIRSIKPEFWTSEQVMECSLNARLMFIGMWNFADDCGRLPLSPKTIKAQIFPSDDISSENILGMIRELSANGLLLIYEVAGKSFLQITGWQHQRIDKPQPAKHPAPVNGYSANVPGMLPPDRKGEEGKGEEVDKIAEAGASKLTEGSMALASAFWKALGFESPKHVPDRLAGIDWRAVSWEAAGWTVDLIEAETRRIGPDKPLNYYEKVFATSFAKRQAPLPIVKIREAEKLTVTHGKPKSAIIQAADDLCRKLASFDGPPRRSDQLRGLAGEAPARLLSNG